MKAFIQLIYYYYYYYFVLFINFLVHFALHRRVYSTAYSVLRSKQNQQELTNLENIFINTGCECHHTQLIEWQFKQSYGLINSHIPVTVSVLYSVWIIHKAQRTEDKANNRTESQWEEYLKRNIQNEVGL